MVPLELSKDNVTPCVGVWIETYPRIIYPDEFSRHTLRGCVDWNRPWLTRKPFMTSHTLRGCVDWNNEVLWYWRKPLKSHPAWVCGLKLFGNRRILMFLRSHPAWVCGLKLTSPPSRFVLLSHTLRGCVDWNSCWQCYWSFFSVTPCVGVWIETFWYWASSIYPWSHPAWVCGLKPPYIVNSLDGLGVTPCVGVWIETNRFKALCRLTVVTPCVGVWIET